MTLADWDIALFGFVVAGALYGVADAIVRAWS